MIYFSLCEFNFDLILCHIQSEICFEVCIFFSRCEVKLHSFDFIENKF